MDRRLEKILDLRELGGEPSRIRMAIRGHKDTCVFSASPQERAHLLWGLERKILYVATDKNAATRMRDIFSEYFDNVLLLTEREDNLIYKGAKQLRNSVDRLAALYKLSCGKADALVVTPEALMQYYPSKKRIRAINIEVGREYSVQELLKELVVLGYKREDGCERQGEFTLAGDILSVFPSDGEYPVRVSFWDTVVEYIHSFDPDTLDKVRDCDRVELLPCAEFSVGAEEIAAANKDVKAIKTRSRERVREILEEISLNYDADNNTAHTQWLACYVKDNVGLAEYIGEDWVIAYEEGKSVIDRAKLFYNDFVNRCNSLIEEGEILPAHKNTFRRIDGALNELNSRTKVAFSVLTGSNPIFSPRAIFNLNSTPISSYYMNFQTLFNDIRGYLTRDYTIVLCCGDDYTAESIKSSLIEENIYAAVTENVPLGKAGVFVTPCRLSDGFIYKGSKLFLIGRNQLIKKREKKVAKRKRNLFVMPQCGDYVVHEVHGIGLCAGIERITVHGAEKDYVLIHYAGGDKLYVPVDQMDRLHKYSGSDVIPKLSKMGGKEFQKVKDKVRQAVREMAFSLLELYKKRNECVGHKYSQDTVWQKEFEESFEYSETDDQQKSVAEIKEDMEKGVVMDRLLCGDVGYGKTEVALRAVFKTINDGKQAAILAPTAILARQHYNTASARFNNFDVKIALLSRFQTKEEIKRSLEGIKSGKINLVIATHRLLSDDVKFYDLGLLVLDEEQRFGVEHKEKMKAVNNSINVLTLSATPIPRTLNMALTGIRDISVLETPPRERLPVATYVTELTDGLLKDAIERELARDGQVFVLFNRVQGIDSFAEHIKALVPDARVIVGHGQMTDIQLENAINDFYNKEGNVLVATTIIENGIDLPDANTIIVCDADRLGLSAMYQLRGRVGRSDKQAYAYFTTRQGKVLTEDAMKRLNAITDYTDFGSGYKIAMRDLEIRGAGNVLGREQHGHIAKVGYDMYCKLLQESVDEITGNGAERNDSVEMQVDIDAFLDKEYILDTDRRLSVFKEIAEVKTLAEKNELIAKLTDNYGKPSEQAVNLIEIAMLKNMAADIGARKVIINAKGAGIVFDASVYKNQAVISAVSDMKDSCVLSADSTPKLVFDVRNMNIAQKIEMTEKFLLNLTKNL